MTAKSAGAIQLMGPTGSAPVLVRKVSAKSKNRSGLGPNEGKPLSR